MDLTKPWLTIHTRNTLIMKDYHLFLFSYIKEKTKNFFWCCMAWHTPRCSYISNKNSSPTFIKIKNTTTLPKRTFKGNSFCSTKRHLFSSFWLIEHQRASKSVRRSKQIKKQEAFGERRHLHVCDLWHVIVTCSLSQELLDYLIKFYPVDKCNFDLSCLYPSGDIPCQILCSIRSTCF